MTEPAIIEAPLVLTLKCSDDRDSPWLVARASNIQQLQSMLLEIENGSIAVDIGRVAATFQNQARIGAKLEAKPLNPATDGGSFDGVKAAATTQPAAAVTTPPVAATPPAAAPAKFPSFGGFKAPAAAPAAAATPPPAAARPASEPPAAAPAVNGFPQAPQWKKP
jgi:hypothetical protein